MSEIKFGWIDFSKEHRNKVLSVINLLSEPGVVDELGVGIIRDAFSDLLFPGTSTIQTRAKYLMIVPYILTELESGNILKPNDFISSMEKQELNLIQHLKEDGETGIIGQTSGQTLKRKPSSIYWNGLRTYNIFKGGRLTLRNYAKAVYLNKKEDLNYKSQLSIQKKNIDGSGDDIDASSTGLSNDFWDLPDFDKNWRENISINLTKKEAEFLKSKIISSCPNSLIGYILEENYTDFLLFETFDQLEGIINNLPETIKNNYIMAKKFADFTEGIHIRFNMILSQYKSQKLKNDWNKWYMDIKKYSSLDLNNILDIQLQVKNHSLKTFLYKCQTAMTDKNIEELDELIIMRERRLKGDSRAKLYNASEFEYSNWVGIKKLQYRMSNVTTILEDIFKGLGEYDAKTG